MTRVAKSLAAVCAAAALALLAAIFWAMAQQPPGAGLDALLATPWGGVTLLDLYIGLALVAAWIHALERDWRRTLAWGVALVALGNLATLAYVLWRLLHAPSVTAALTPRR